MSIGKRKPKGDPPTIRTVSPPAAIVGGEIQISGQGFGRAGRPRVRFGGEVAPLIVGSDSFLVVRVPEGAAGGQLTIENDGAEAPWSCDIGIQVADSLHPVANPAVDYFGNIYTTFSGARGQKTPVSVYKIDSNYQVKPFLSDLMNATGLAFDSFGMLYVSSRFDGVIFRASAEGQVSVHVEGMGIATGLAFDPDGNLYVGDRSGTIFKISPERQIYVFATLEPSVAAYHLAFGPGGYLYVTGPTTSSFDAVYRVDPNGDVEVFYRGLGRPQGMAFDEHDNLYVVASIGGRKGVVRLTPEREAELVLSGPNLVGLAFSNSGGLILASNNAVYRVDIGVRGRPLP